MESEDSFYDECISNMIRQSKLEFRKIHTQWHCMRRHAEMGRAQMIFFEEHKDRLIRRMGKQNLGRDLLKISAFLNHCFIESFAARSASGGLRKIDGILRFDDTYLARDDTASAQHQKLPLLSSGCCSYRGRLENPFEPAWSDGSLIDDEDDGGFF